MNSTVRQIGLLTFIAFILHIIWENAQAPLFQGYTSFTQHFPICFLGTIGDVVFTLFIYLLVSLLVKRKFAMDYKIKHERYIGTGNYRILFCCRH